MKTECPGCERPECQECCEHDEFDHEICLNCGYERDPGIEVELVEYCVKNNTKEGDFVFDPFGGSGSTLIACEKLGRKCRTIEIDPRYCDVIVERWEKYTAKKAILLERK